MEARNSVCMAGESQPTVGDQKHVSSIGRQESLDTFEEINRQLQRYKQQSLYKSIDSSCTTFNPIYHDSMGSSIAIYDPYEVMDE